MLDRNEINKKNGRLPDSPYKNLFIYYIRGHLKQPIPDFGTNFIGNWEEDDFSFLFFSTPSTEKLYSLLISQPHLTVLDKFNMTYNEWQGGEITPFEVGNFFIAPPWAPKPVKHADNKRLDLILDPSVVFGTGKHTTTNDCLEALEMAFHKQEIDSVVDLGTGTGLLSIAASSLGCKRTIAVDFNFLAAKTAENNVKLNQMEDKILVVQAKAEDFINCTADLLIANIHYDVMQHLIESKEFLKFKQFILSGLLRSQAKTIADRLTQLPVRVVKTWAYDGIWHTFFGKTE